MRINYATVPQPPPWHSELLVDTMVSIDPDRIRCEHDGLLVLSDTGSIGIPCSRDMAAQMARLIDILVQSATDPAGGDPLARVAAADWLSPSQGRQPSPTAPRRR
jgi:hypothetical protein